MLRIFKNVILAEYQRMQLFKDYVAWCNKLTTIYGMFGWACAMALSHLGQGHFQQVLVSLGFAAFFRLMIILHDDF